MPRFHLSEFLPARMAGLRDHLREDTDFVNPTKSRFIHRNACHKMEGSAAAEDRNEERGRP